jgi:hypothetical protein
MDIALNSIKGALDFRVFDDSGKPVSGLVAATLTPIYWSLAGPTAANPFGTLVDLPSTSAPWVQNGIIEKVDATYRLDYPDVLAANLGKVTIFGDAASGQHIVAPLLEVNPVVNPLGTGPTLVNHNFGGLDNLTVENPSGGGVQGAQIRAYLATDYNLGRTDAGHIVGLTTTDAAGHWVAPLMLSPGYSYILVISQPNFYQTQVRQINV